MKILMDKTYADIINEDARFWIGVYTRARDEGEAPHDVVITKYVERLLCPHTDARLISGAAIYCPSCKAQTILSRLPGK